MLTQELSNQLHERLLGERTRLQGEIDNLTHSSRADVFDDNETDAVDQHPADAGSELFEREKNMTLRRNEQVSLDAVNRALVKFEEGTYGVCENCGNPIPERRLKAMPEAVYDVDCQSKLEKQAQSAANR